MAFSITFKMIPRSQTGHQRQYKVLSFDRPGRFTPKQHYLAKDMLTIRPGVRGYIPIGVDTRTPGFAKEWTPDRTSNPMP